MDSLVEYAYAKLNLSLDVIGKRSDGFHDLRMVMQTISLSDRLELSLNRSGKINVSSNLYYLPCDRRNIAYKAADAFFKLLNTPHLGVNISMEKSIPVCAGMGGGSADGAAVLRGLNTMLGKPFSLSQLEDLGASLGSDIPFCIAGGTALAEGKGERLTPLAPLADCSIVICKPRFSVSTPELFQRLSAASVKLHPDTQGILDSIGKNDIRGVSMRLFNVFEDVLHEGRDDVSAIKHSLLDSGALGALMTGTGSAVFGIFQNSLSATEAKTALLKKYPEVFLAKPKARLEI